MHGLLAFFVIPAIALACSERWRSIQSRVVLPAFGMQAVLAVILIRFPGSQMVLRWLDHAVTAFQTATDTGDALVFGYLGGAPLPFAASGPGSPYVLAFHGLPLVLTISALSAVLYHWGLLQRVMGGLAWLLRRSMGLSGPLAMGAATHIFVGMIEAPLLIRPYLGSMQRGELFALMSCGMAGIAGTVMVIYAAILGPVIGNALGTILIASVISTPAALALSAIMVPFDPVSAGSAPPIMPQKALNALDALVRGAMAGVQPLVGIVVMLITAVATVSFINQTLSLIPAGHSLTLQSLAAIPFRPLLWCMGIPWIQTAPASMLMATKTVLNEFVAYLALAQASPEMFTPRSRVILVYALCGFANFGSLGIMIGGLVSIVPPERRPEVVSLGMRSLVSGTLATCMSGAWAGLLSP